uniref:DNA mismatch repair protein n=1 Tax=Timema genevievae TaxID=629358 RepID=A0A7R9PJ88_TIMGE|nr:unnamed protein product [Timema genevievae]
MFPSSNARMAENSIEFALFDVVWAKQDGYPYWPALVCNSPNSKKNVRGSEIHVQFFDVKPSRSWIKKKHVEMYKKKTDKICPLKYAERWRQASAQAESALLVSVSQRCQLLTDLTATKKEEEDSDIDSDESLDSTDLDNDIGNNMFHFLNVLFHGKNKKMTTHPLKKRQLIYSDDDSEEEFKPKKLELEEESDSNSSGVPSDDISDQNSDIEDDIPVKVKKRKHPPGKNRDSHKKMKTLNGTTPSLHDKSVLNLPGTSQTVGAATKIKLATLSKADSGETLTDVKRLPAEEEIVQDSWSHLKYDFLKPEKIRDGQCRLPSDPEYNPRTLFVPQDFKNNLTPAMRQWWDMKCQHFDCVLFFKVGKFYELYHMDAVIGFNELNLMYMKGDHAHSGFPEIAYGRFSSSLIEKGYKVARVEQTETPDMMANRCKNISKVTKFDKVVKREICQITTRGTKVFSVIDGEAKEAKTNFLLALTEKVTDGNTSFGICFIDTSIGVFHLGQFDDDRHFSSLRTLLAHYPPVQVLYERGTLSEKIQKLLNSVLVAVNKEALAPETEFWGVNKTLTTLAEGGYFTTNSAFAWPEGLKDFISDSSSLGLCARDDTEMAIRALGAITWYLKQCHIDQQLLTMGKFKSYSPPDCNESRTLTSTDIFAKHMVLDGITLQNLDILENSMGEKEGTLINKLDSCCTPFGKRLLHQWICSPLCDLESIRGRQEAVTQLMKSPHIVQEARAALSQLPDLERLLSRIHAQGNELWSKTHPDSRAIFYEDKIYSKKKIIDFTNTLNGFKCALKVALLFKDADIEFTSKLIVQLTNIAPLGNFPEMEQSLHFFETAFDHEEATKHGHIIPMPGVDPEYDSTMKELSHIQKELDEYLISQRKIFGTKVVYFGSDKKRFQLEVSDTAAKKAGSEYELLSQRKGFKRFGTQTTKDLLSRQLATEEQKKNVLKDLSRRIFEQFSSRYTDWSRAVQCLAVLDVLLTFTEYSLGERETCMPTFVLPSNNIKPYLKISNGLHPCLSSMDGFIPNDTSIGCDDSASLILVTGPNMGGKSTLMRQVGLIIVLAHMGCRVPALSCELTPVDRIFTRLGANDDIMAGESTFLVELSETASILQHATRHSLVLVDELGRGTATYDGTAIAVAVVYELVRLNARTLFSTHYHTLVEDFKNSKCVSLNHMACMVENESDDPSEETVTFLYKFVSGPCPKSYGFNAAKLAGIPGTIVQRSYEKALELEKQVEKKRVFLTLMGAKDVNVSHLVKLMPILCSL